MDFELICTELNSCEVFRHSALYLSRSGHTEALEVYLHIFQSFSTTESGVEALGMYCC